MQQGDLTVLVVSFITGVVYPVILIYACNLMYGV